MRLTRVAATVLAVVLGGCATQSAPATSSTTSPATSTTSTGANGSGSGASADLTFQGTRLDGSTFEGASLKGKPAVLWFWAPWCPTCRSQISNISALAETHDGAVAVVGVGGLDSKAAIEKLAADIPHLTHLVDEDGQVWRHFRVTAQSTYTVIDADGGIVSEGYLEDEELNDLVDTLVADGA